MKRFLKSKKGVAGLMVTLAVVGASAFGAYAYLTNTGTGSGTPVQVGTQAPPYTIALDSNLSGAGGTLNAGTPTFTNGNTQLLPTIIGDANKDVATVPFTITNGSEANELLSSYTITIENSAAGGAAPYTTWFSCGTGGGTISSCTNGLAACTAADFAINPGTAGDSPVTVTLGTAVDLSPLSDAPANSRAYTFDIQLVDLGHNQDNCENQSPPIVVSATS